MTITATSVHTPAPIDEEISVMEDVPVEKRALVPHTSETAKTPFRYDPNALKTLRPDQVPRFFGVLTDTSKLPTQEISLDSLWAMQNRVDPGKVRAIAANSSNKLAAVVHNNGRNYIADGHHRLTADWLAGKPSAMVHYKDISSMDNALKREPDASFRIAKVDESLGLVFGWAIVCKHRGEDYYDLNVDWAGQHAGQRVPEHIPEHVMMKAVFDLTKGGHAPGNEMHEGPDSGHYPFLFPMTTEIAKAMGVTTEKTGLMVAYYPTPDVLAKFKTGEYKGFSIEGKRLAFEEKE